MNRNPDTHAPMHTDPFGEDPVFAELQALWDEQNRRIDQMLAEHPAPQLRTLDLRHCRTWRDRAMTRHMVLALLNVAAGVCALLFLLTNPYHLIHIAGIVLASINALLAAYCLYNYIVISLHHPARTGVIRMSHFISRMNMRPHYAPASRGAGGAESLRGARPARRGAWRPFPAVSFPQVATVSAAIFVVLTSAACSPVGDGHAMTRPDRASRSVAIENVGEMLAHV